MARANSLKKAVRSVLDMTEREIESQAEVTAEVNSLLQPVLNEESEIHASPNLSPCSSQSSIDSGRRGSDMGPQSLDFFESRGSVDSGQRSIDSRTGSFDISQPRASIDSEGRGMDLGLMSSQGGTESGPHTRHNRTSVSSLVSVVEPAPVLRETREVSCMNNYFGIGLDAQIAYDFHNTRERNQIKSRTKNKMLYGILAGKEFFANSQQNLERKISLECDGHPVSLPSRLQGLVFLNIPSYMAGTNFWGTDREKRSQGFSAPSYDDKLVEVVGVTGITQVTTAKVLGIQNQRIAQCRYAKINIHSPDTLPMQVDGEAWLQEPGIIVVSHKNKARIIFKNKIFSQSLESWKQKNPATLPVSPQRPVGVLDYLTEEEIERYRSAAHATRALMELVRQEGASGNADVSRDLVPLLASTSATLGRVFPEDQISETADLQHLEDFKREMGALVEETLYTLDKKKVTSSVLAERMRECVETLKCHVDAISASEVSSTGAFRRVSDSAILRDTHPSPSSSSSTPSAHRRRAACIQADPDLSAEWFTKKCGKEVSEWDCDDVCWWMEELGLKEYNTAIHVKEIDGRKLLELQPRDIQEFGIVKVSHLTKLRTGIQALNPSLHSGPGAIKRARQFRETR